MMRPSDKRGGGSMVQEQLSLETPAAVGYRAGMSETGVIGRKLGTLYSVDTDIPSSFDTAIEAVRRQFGRRN